MKKVVFIVSLLLVMASISVSAISFNNDDKQYEVEYVEPLMVATHLDQSERVDYASNDSLEQREDAGSKLVYLPTSYCNTQYEVVEFTENGIYNIGCEDTLNTTSYSADTYAIIENGRIVYSNNAIVSTIGGTDYVAMMYPTIEDAYNQENGVIINGGAYTGQYIETLMYNEEKFVHLNIGGFVGYMSFEEVQILPMPLVEAQTYYAVDGENWVKYIANDPLDSSKGYSAHPVDEAPEFAEEGVKYYSPDDETYYPENPTMTINSRKDEKYSDGNYFQDLPVRSTSAYTGADYKSYLTYMGKTNSEYYNYTSEFVDMQNSENLNSLLMFSWANLESGYGTSSLSKSCHNFWGWNAPDSDPSKCTSSPTTTGHYGDVESGVNAQGFNIPTHFIAVEDWRYAGSHVGNKQAGINYKYASDPDWGSKIGGMAYEVDKYLGGVENDLYRIAELTKSANAYKTSNLGNGEKIVDANGNTYTIKKGGTSSTVSGAGIHVIVTDEATGSAGKALEIQLDTALNYSGSSTCKQPMADYGYYPSYNGDYTVTGVGTGEYSYACEYEYEFSRGWIYESNTEIIHDNEIFVPGDKLTLTPTASSYSIYIDSTNTFNLHEGYYPVVGVLNSEKTGNVFGYQVIVDNQTGETSFVKLGDVLFDDPYYSVYEVTANAPVLMTPGGTLDYTATVGTKFVVIDKNYPGPSAACPNGANTTNWVKLYKDNGWEIGYVPDCYLVDDLGETPYLNGYIENVTLNGTKLHIEGPGYIQYLSANDSDHDYSMTLKNSSNSYTFDSGFGVCTKTERMSSYSKRDGVDYSKAYFCTSNSAGVDISGIAPGTYDIYVTYTEPGYTASKKMTAEMPNQTLSYKDGKGYEYIVTINNKNITVTKKDLVSDPPYLNGYIENVKLNGTKLHIEGPAYIQYVSASDYEHNYTMTLKNSTNSYTFSSGFGVCTKTDRMSSYSERDQVDYSKAYFCTSNSEGVDISSIAPGTYDIYVTYTEPSYTASKKMTAEMPNQTLSYKDGKGYEYIVTINNKNITVTKKDLVSDAPYLNGYIENVKLNGTKLHIEGPGYIQYVSASDYEHDYTMTLKNSANSYTFDSGFGVCTKNDRMSSYSERDQVDYSKAYFCTSNSAGVDISGIAPGTYDIYVTYTEPGYTASKKMIAEMPNQTLSYKDGKGYEYIVTINNKNITVTKKYLVSDAPYLNGYIENVKLNGTKLHIEGPAYIQYVSASDYEHNYTMTLKNSTNSYTFDSGFGVCTKTDRMSSYSERDQVDYSKAYFCTSNSAGVDVSGIAPGTYDIYVTYTEPGYTASKKMTAEMPNQTLSYKDGKGYEYIVTINNKNITVTKKDLVSDPPYLNGYIEKVKLNGSNLHIEGPAYIQYVSASDYEHDYSMTLKNSTNSYTFDSGFGVCTKTDRMSSYSERDQVDYSKAYFCTSNSAGVDISTIAPGTYDIYVTYTEPGYTASKKMTAEMPNQTIKSTSGGYEYILSINNKKITITKK